MHHLATVSISMDVFSTILPSICTSIAQCNHVRPLFAFVCCKCSSDGASARHHYLRSLNAFMPYRMPIFQWHRRLHRNYSFCLRTRMLRTFWRLFSNKHEHSDQNTTYSCRLRELWLNLMLNIRSHFGSCAHNETFYRIEFVEALNVGSAHRK